MSAAIAGLAVTTAFGRGVAPLLDAVWAGRPGFASVDRFDVTQRRVRVAATGPRRELATELVGVVTSAAADAGLTAGELAGTPLVLAVHGEPGRPRGAADLADVVAAGAGTGPALRAYTSACVAASTAVASAATWIERGADRVVVAAGYLVESDQFALFDAARALAADGQVRPFSADRSGLLLGDGVAAVVLESPAALARRGHTSHGWLHGWGATGDAHHVTRPHPDGTGLARAMSEALARARVRPADVGYVNAHGSGAPHSDRAEAHALHRVLPGTPVSSTKSVHGQALEASALVELIATVESLRHGRLPVNAGYRAADADCPVDVIDRPGTTDAAYAMSVNCAFGGANTALLVGAP